MTVVVTRNVVDRFRGFLASCMLEVAPGVYTAPRMNAAVRNRVWLVMEEWFGQLGGGAFVERDHRSGFRHRKKGFVSGDDPAVVQRVFHKKDSMCRSSGSVFTHGRAARLAAAVCILP